MKRIISILLLIAVLLSTIILTSCDVAKIILGIFDLVKEDNTNININIGGTMAHVHTEGVIPAIESTCNTHGKTEGRYCLSCEKILVPQEEAPLKAHTYDNDSDAICNICGNYRDITCLHTNEVILNAKESSCTETGLTEGKKCADCGEILIEQKSTSLKEHTPSEWIVDYDSTSTEKGLKHIECLVCKEIMYQATIPVLGSTSSKLRYSINDDGQGYTVTGIGTCADTDIIIPSEYDGLPVTSIGERAFKFCTSLTSIIIPNSVTSIGERAFEACTSLTSVTIGNSVTDIGAYAFSECASLTSVTIPDSVTDIGDGVFNQCDSLTSVTIGNSVTSIGKSTFSSCTSLARMTIGNSVTSISEFAFNGCYSLIEICNKSSLRITAGSNDYGGVGRYAKHIITDESQSAIKYVGDYVFFDDGTDIYLVKYFGNESEIMLPKYDSGKKYGIMKFAFFDNDRITSVTIPDFVTSIGDDALAYCNSLTSIEISDSVTSIGNEAFCGCTSLTSIIIPDSVGSIGYFVFGNCKSLTIFCEADSQPSTWNSSWNSSDTPVVWGYTGE